VKATEPITTPAVSKPSTANAKSFMALKQKAKQPEQNHSSSMMEDHSLPQTQMNQ
jgi:hypothetical protein